MNGKHMQLILAAGCLLVASASSPAQFFPNTGPGSSAGQPGFPPAVPAGAAPKAADSPIDVTKPRTFTDSRGQAVTGTLMSLEGAGVAVIKMESGGTIRARVLDLSQDDQKYIRDWYAQQVLQKGNTLRIKAERQKGDKTETSIQPPMPPGALPGGGAGLPSLPLPGGLQVTTQNAFYHVELTNRGALSLEKPKVEYYIFKKGEGSPVATGFIEEPPVIGTEKSYEFDTKPVALLLGTEKKDGPGGGPGGDGDRENRDKSKRDVKETLSGIWLRVYEGETMIGEFADPVALKQNNTWPPGAVSGSAPLAGQAAGQMQRPPQRPQGGGAGGFGPPPQGGGQGQLPPPPGGNQPLGNNAPPLNSGTP